MKHKLITLLLLTLSTLTTSAQTQEAKQLLLNVEKLARFKQILADMKTGYQVLSTGYNSIKDLSEGNFSLHKTFLDGLMQVSPAVRKYKRIADIINAQLYLLKEYKSATKRLSVNQLFNQAEIDYTIRIYGRLVNESLQNLDDLTIIITAGKLRMSDTERITEIDRIYQEMQDKLNFLRHFKGQTAILALQRANEQRDIAGSLKAYGLSTSQ